MLALELEEVSQGSEEEEKKLDLERVEEEEEERSMRGQDVEIWRRELPPGHCLGRGQLRPYQDLHSFIMTSHRWTEVKVFRKESEKGSTSELSIPY